MSKVLLDSQLSSTPTSHVKYNGDLRTTATHLRSGTQIITDAPIDNHGKGEAFSPTDLVATAYASCMISILGIYCNAHNLNFVNGEASVLKIMSEVPPRKIARIEIALDLSGNGWDASTQTKVMNVCKTCPVALTLDEYVDVELFFNF